MIRDVLIDTASRLHLDEPLLRMRSAISPRYRGQTEERRQLRRILGSILAPTSNCIDIGAYRGRILAEMVRAAPRGRHIAYEPLPELNRLLARRFPEVDIRLAAVSDHVGETTFTMVRDDPGLSGFRDRWEGREHDTVSLRVRLETLDTDLPAGYVPDLIKVDVEGAERLVFAGGMKLISTHKPTIIFEHGKNGAEHYASGPSDVFSALTGEGGLRIFDLDGNGPYSEAQFEEAFWLNERWDFLARA